MAIEIAVQPNVKIQKHQLEKVDVIAILLEYPRYVLDLITRFFFKA